MCERFSFTKEDSFQLFKKMFLENWKTTPSKKWFDDCYDIREKRWSTIGPNLRREVCIPAATGVDLQQIYQNAWYEIGNASGMFWPTPHRILNSSDILENQRVKCPTGERKLTRFLAEYLVNEGSYTKDKASAFVSQVQDKVRRSNGARIIISAHPLDVLLSSIFTTNWDSCHDWTNKKGDGHGGYSAGNFQYAIDPKVLIAYSYEEYKYYEDYDVKFPCKKWRQLLFAHEERHEVLYLSREYPGNMSELQHYKVRQTIAEILTKQDNPPWRYHNVEIEQDCVKTKYFYADGMKGCIKTGEHREVDDCSDTIYIDPCICPSCNSRRSDGDVEKAVCKGCVVITRKCTDCDEDVDIDHADDFDGWISGSRGYICPSCASSYTCCDRCHESYANDEVTTLDDENRTLCQYCLSGLGYTQCSHCSEYFRSTYEHPQCECQVEEESEAQPTEPEPIVTSTNNHNYINPHA